MKCTSLLLMLTIATAASSQTITVGKIGSPAALTFPSTTGNKIVLEGNGNTFHTGIGLQGGILQFYTKSAAGNIIFNYGVSYYSITR